MRRFIEMVGRMIFWGWHLRNSHDWDYNYLYHIIYLKLYRMKKEMLDKGPCVWEHDNKGRCYKSLIIATELARRISMDDYGHSYYGEYLDTQQLDPIELIGTKMSDKKRRNCMQAMLKDKSKKELTYNEFHEIMRKWSRYWWD